MKIYFAGSIRGGRENQELYCEIIKMLQKYGTVLTEHVGDRNLSAGGEDKITDEIIFKRDTDWLCECDVMIAEVTTPSLGVGYEIGKMENQKPILCLFHETNSSRLSAMIAGNSILHVEKYHNQSDIENILKNFLEERR